MGYWMDWNNPQTFQEKVQWLKVYDRHSEYTKMVDKVAAKEYVAGIIGEQYIIPTLGVWETADEVDFKSLPNRFVIKCNHNSGLGMYICKDKSAMDEEKVKRDLKRGLNQNYVIQNREYPYKNVPRRIIAEKYMEDKDCRELKDYKFFCFGGKAEYCQVIANRSTDEAIDFYDREWVHQPFIGLNPKAHHSLIPHKKPDNYGEMLVMADSISKDVNAPFVRIDFYNVAGHIYLGEITFFPASGFGKITPKEWDYKLGEMINLPKR